ncbi:MBL fold metallo-hydrolase [Fulvivirgaceae bacterium PWU5]|uniref:MBL fold metallo-hydrolase n=1 Tax=Dawidia cretensis TaxID=2782350 RepID=A0AAP2DVW7_9BACT|nr:MBL fold metallo-hydrolase [Dawidia cretensis]MBT1708353.1 MBL fold metallo-hydrolase [Dawidia cretensis]
MKTTLYLFLMLFATATWAQRAPADILQTSKGPLTIQPLHHATLALTWQGKTIYADPDGGAEAFQGIAPPDLILITDIHGDHFNPATLEAIPASKAIIVAPQAVADKMPEGLKAKVVVLNNGQTTNQLGISIKAIPMYNLPEAADAKHTKGRGNGYVLTFGNKTVYLSGDTAGIPEMRSLKNIDVAFVCMNLPYTMDVPEAAAAVLDFKPKIVYPYHYRGANGLSDTDQFKKLVQASDKSIDVRTRNWYPN